MTHPTFKEHLSLLEARSEGVKYTEKQVKNVLDKVTATLSSHEAGVMTKLAKRYARLEASMKAMKIKHEELNARLKGDVQGYFDAEDVVLTRVVETAQFTLTMAKEIKKTTPTTSIDYAAIAEALAELIPDELQSKVDEIAAKYTTIVPPKDPVSKLSVSKEVVKEGILERAASFFKSIMSWASRFDSKLDKLKKKAGMVNEGNTIAYYDEKNRQRKENALTASNVVKKLNASGLPQAIVNDFKTAAKEFTGELTKADIKDICKKAKISSSDSSEILDILEL